MPLEVLTPKAGKGPGVLVVHPWWGLNRTTRGYGAALAAEGFVVGLADLFEGETASTIEEAGATPTVVVVTTGAAAGAGAAVVDDASAGATK